MADTKPETSTPEAEAPAAPAIAPIFGSNATFGTTGFGGFAGVVKAEASGEAAAEGGEDEEAATEEECKAEFKPIVQLEEVEVSTGEEDEAALFDAKSKLYRFDNENSEWKERGVGQARLLQHKENKKIRFLMREGKTLKIRANHIVMPGTKVQEHSGSDKAMVWSCVDFADNEQRVELFCIRFASSERAQEFQKAYHDACESMEKLLAGGPAPETVGKSEADQAADELAAAVEEKATVEDKEDA